MYVGLHVAAHPEVHWRVAVSYVTCMCTRSCAPLPTSFHHVANTSLDGIGAGAPGAHVSASAPGLSGDWGCSSAHLRLLACSWFAYLTLSGLSV